MSEDELLKAVLEMAELFGWRACHFRPGLNKRGQWQTAMSGKHAAGFPDLVLVRDRVLFVELKSAIGKPSAYQYAWLEALNHVAEETAYLDSFVWRPADWKSGQIESQLR